MSELIDREALKDAVKRYAGEPIKAKDKKCQAICLDMLGTIDAQSAASPWHRVEDGLPEMSEIASGYVCSETLVLYDDETGYMDIGYVKRKPNGNEVYWFWVLPLKTPTHWMPIEPPKEEE